MTVHLPSYYIISDELFFCFPFERYNLRLTGLFFSFFIILINQLVINKCHFHFAIIQFG